MRFLKGLELFTTETRSHEGEKKKVIPCLCASMVKTPSGDSIFAEGLFHCQLGAGTGDRLLRKAVLNELEAVAERLALAHERMYFNLARGQGEFQSHHFSERNLDAQHGRDARCAEVDRVSAYDLLVSRIYANVDLEFVAGMAASFDVLASLNR